MEQELFAEQEEELDLRELFHVIRKRIVLVLILPVICAVAAGSVSYFLLKPVYQASVSIIISQEPGVQLTESDVMMYQDLVKTYTEIAKSSVVAERAVDDGNLNISAGALQGGLTVESEAGTQVLKLSVKSGQPSDAAKQAEAAAQAFLQESKRLLPSGTVNIMDHAKVPKAPIKPNKRLNVIIAFAVGLMAAVGLALLMEFMNDNIRSEEDVEKYLGVRVIGIIPKNV